MDEEELRDWRGLSGVELCSERGEKARERETETTQRYLSP